MCVCVCVSVSRTRRGLGVQDRGWQQCQQARGAWEAVGMRRGCSSRAHVLRGCVGVCAQPAPGRRCEDTWGRSGNEQTPREWDQCLQSVTLPLAPSLVAHSGPGCQSCHPPEAITLLHVLGRNLGHWRGSDGHGCVPSVPDALSPFCPPSAMANTAAARPLLHTP